MEFNDYQQEATKTRQFPEKIALGYLGLGIAGEAGEIAEKIKKLYRDHGGEPTWGWRNEVVKEMGDLLWYLSQLAEELQTNLNFVAEVNLDKVRDRQKRDVIKGEGDNR